ncbi:hypothetical protein Tco_0310463, partial [Tanacetum coccineum]
MDMSNIARKRSKTNKKREKDKESRARVRTQPEIKAGSARHSRKESQRDQRAKFAKEEKLLLQEKEEIKTTRTEFCTSPNLPL